MRDNGQTTRSIDGVFQESCICSVLRACSQCMPFFVGQQSYVKSKASKGSFQAGILSIQPKLESCFGAMLW